MGGGWNLVIFVAGDDYNLKGGTKKLNNKMSIVAKLRKEQDRQTEKYTTKIINFMTNKQEEKRTDMKKEESMAQNNFLI